MNQVRRKPARLLITLFLMFPWLSSCAGTPNPSTNDSLPETFATALKRFQAQYKLPGITATYVLPDGAGYSAAAGWADVESGAPMSVSSRMLAASIGKTFVAATTVSLARERNIDLDAPVSNWLGHNAWFERLPNHQSITLRHLLTQTSGLPNHVYMPAFVDAVARQWSNPGNPFTPDVLISFILDTEPLFSPGVGWSYSDTGYILAGLVIESVTKRSYYEELEERFLAPLKLDQTTPSDQRLLANLATGYVAADNPFGFPPKTIDHNGFMAWHPGLEWTGGGLISTSRDLAHWGDALFRGRAMPAPYLDTMLDSVAIGADAPGVNYGLGIAINRSSELSPVYGHGGWIPGYSSSLRHYSQSEITIAFQVNTDRVPQSKLSDVELCLARIVISAGKDIACVP